LSNSILIETVTAISVDERNIRPETGEATQRSVDRWSSQLREDGWIVMVEVIPKRVKFAAYSGIEPSAKSFEVFADFIEGIGFCGHEVNGTTIGKHPVDVGH